jgi:hypothetical protein
VRKDRDAPPTASLSQQQSAALGISSPPGAAGAAKKETTDKLSSAVMSVMFVVVAGVIYFLPSLVASARSHNNSTAIFAFNILLGWTFLGWVAAFVWALTADTLPHDKVVVGYNKREPPPLR